MIQPLPSILVLTTRPQLSRAAVGATTVCDEAADGSAKDGDGGGVVVVVV